MRGRGTRKFAQPNARSVHQDVLLTNMLLGWKNLPYIADQIFPIIGVDRQSNIIPGINQSAFFRDEAKLRAPGSSSVRGGFTYNKNLTYFCDRYSFGKEISDDERDNQDRPFDVDRDSAYFVADKLQMRREVQFVADFMQLGIWGTDKTGVTNFTQWDDYGNSQPIVDMTTFMDISEGMTGFEANKMVLGKPVWLKLVNHPDFLERMKYTQVPKVTPEIVAGMFGLPTIYIGKAIQTTAQEGTAEASVTYNRIHGKYAWIGYTSTGASIGEPTAGATFVWQRVANAIQYIKRMRNEEREIDIIEGNSYFDQKLLVKQSGVFLSAVVA